VVGFLVVATGFFGVVFLFCGVLGVVFPELFVVALFTEGFFAGVDDFFFGGIMFADFFHV